MAHPKATTVSWHFSGSEWGGFRISTIDGNRTICHHVPPMSPDHGVTHEEAKKCGQLIAAAPDLWKSAMIDHAFKTIGYTQNAIAFLVQKSIEEAGWVANNHSAIAMAKWADEKRQHALAKARGE